MSDLTGEESHICLLGVCLLITYVPSPPIYKWKNHFSEMKGDVGMSLHEKEVEQEDA